MLGRPRIKELLRPRCPTSQIAVLIAFPVVRAAAFRLISASEYEKHTLGVALLLASTTLGNGVCGEILWHGDDPVSGTLCYDSGTKIVNHLFFSGVAGRLCDRKREV